jgi:hypothetical protein
MTDSSPTAGVYDSIPAEDYHRFDGGILSKSRLWPMVESFKNDGSLKLCPARCKWFIDNPKPQTRDMLIGDATDTLLFEPREFNQRFVMSKPCSAPKRKGSTEPCGAPGKVLVDGEWRCGTHGRDGEPLPDDKTLLTHEEMATVRSLARSLADDPTFRKYLANARHTQVAVIGEICGQPFKGRFDLLTYDEQIVLNDLKTARACEPHRFIRDAMRLGYHVQLAAYREIASQHSLVDDDSRVELSVVGKTPRFGIGMQAVFPVQHYEISADLLELGARHLAQLIDTYTRCVEEDSWPVEPNEKCVMSVPAWMSDDEEPETDDDSPPWEESEQEWNTWNQ